VAILLRLILMVSLIAGWDAAASAQDAKDREFLEAVEKAPVFFDAIRSSSCAARLRYPHNNEPALFRSGSWPRRATQLSTRPQSN
jgi:hypothetical protein